MAKALLLIPDVAIGEEVLSTLDRAKFPVTVALWLLQKERSDWNVVIGTPLYDKLGAYEAYLRAINALSPEGLSQIPFRLLSNRNPLIKALRKLYGKTAAVEGKRIGGRMIGGAWIDDAYVYRIK